MSLLAPIGHVNSPGQSQMYSILDHAIQITHTMIALYWLFTRWIRQKSPEDWQNIELFSHVLTPTVSAHTPEVLSPAVVTISESGETSVRVSWGPLQPQTVTSYFIEYSALPGGSLHTRTVSRTQNSTLLENLQPGTTYLVTVTARHASGTERAMSVKVCTQEGERWVFTCGKNSLT